MMVSSIILGIVPLVFHA